MKIFKNEYVKIFSLAFLIAFMIFLPYLIMDKGFFLYAGDFNSQQIPFYMYGNEIIKSGDFAFSWASDLGSSFINTYSFYFLGTPFFYLSLLFPAKAVPYIMPYLLMLKFAFAALGAYLYLKRYSKNTTHTYIAAILYAFSGFSIYNIFFNHFVEAVVFFPYMLFSLDEYMYKQKKGLFAIFVAINLLNNYFFFLGQILFLIIYFVTKVKIKDYKLTIEKFFTLAFESIIGFLMGAILLIPAIPNLLSNPRVIRPLSEFGLWLYGEVQQYFAILFSALLPPDPAYNPSLFTEGALKWNSLSIFIALGGLYGFFLFLKKNKKSAFFIVFSICILFAFVPILNSSFYAFNTSYYARWFYMPSLMLVAMNMQGFSYEKEDILNSLKPIYILLIIPIIFALTPVFEDEFKIGLSEDPEIFLTNLLIGILSVFILQNIVQYFYEKENYSKLLLLSSICLILIFSISHIGFSKMPQEESDSLYKIQNYDILDSFSLYDDDENQDFRIDNYQSYNNFGLFVNYPSLQFFNSTVNPNILEFYPSVGVKRDVSSKPEVEFYALRGLLSVKYYVTPNWEADSLKESTDTLTFSDHIEEYPYTILKNDYFVPFGFTLDYFVSYDDLNTVEDNYRSNILMRAIALEDVSVLEEYNLTLPYLPSEELNNTSFETYLLDCENRKEDAGYYFEMRGDGFISKINLDEDNLVFYSAAYDEGFTAYVNGVETEILKVNYGLMAVFAPSGDNEIIFEYKTPYLNLSLTISFISFIIFIGYLIINKKKK